MKNDIAVIKVNGVDVGSMPLAEYEEIVESVRSDWKIRVWAIISLFGSLLTVAKQLIKYFATSFAAAFVVLMIFFQFSHGDSISFIESLRAASPAEIADGMSNVTGFCMVVSFMWYVASLFIRGVDIQPSVFDKAINKRIREVMEVPAVGYVTVSIPGLNASKCHVR